MLLAAGGSFARQMRRNERRCLCRPRVAVVSTPNAEYNEVIRSCAPLCDADPLKPLGADGRPMRDRDHKFEWTRAEFQAWAGRHAGAAGYAVSFQGVGLAMDHQKWALAAADGGRDIGHATQVRPPTSPCRGGT